MQSILVAFIGTGEAVVIGIVFLVLFGAKKVPELMKGLGQGMREFKKASREVQDELERAAEEPSRPVTPRRPVETVVHEPTIEKPADVPPVGSAKL